MNRLDEPRQDDLDAFERALLAELREHVSTRRAPSRLRRRAPLLVAAAAVLTAGVVTAAVVLPQHDDGHRASAHSDSGDRNAAGYKGKDAIVKGSPPAVPTPVPADPAAGELKTDPATSSTVLVSAAYHARQAAPGHGRYWYAKVVNHQGKQNLTDEDWTAIRGGIVWSRGPDGKVSGIDYSKFPGWNGTQFSYCDKDVKYAELAKLPTDPDGLLGTMRDAMAHGSDGVVPKEARGSFTVECLLGVSQLPVSPGVRSAAFLALNKLPGTSYVGPRKDSLGRPGIELSFTDRGAKAEAIFSKKDGSVLEYDLNGYGGGGKETVLAAQWAP